jgi:hypothetical protein
MVVSGMATRAAIGFSLHTGWAALVAIAGEPGRLEVLLRRRIELLPSDSSVPRFVYHEAAKLGASQGAELVQRAEDASQAAARIAIEDALDHLRSVNCAAIAAGIPCNSRPVPKDLSTVLRSHPMIHTAEGILFQQALAWGCRGCGLTVTSAGARDVWLTASNTWGLKEATLHKQVDDLRASAGPPWGRDQKTGTAFALLALRPAS